MTIGAGVALALVVGAVLLPRLLISGPQPDRTPFDQAVADLYAQSAARYSGSSPDGGMTWDLISTIGGETLGTVTLDGQQMSVMTVGGETYVKPPPNLLASLPSSVDSSSIQGKWITGDDTLTAMLPTGLNSPADVASSLWSALNVPGTHFPTSGATTVAVGSTQALEAVTPQGNLYVTATAPYRVLRWTPGTGSTRVTGAAWHRPAANIENADSAGPAALGELAVEPMSPAEVDQAYGDLIDQTKSLTSAVNVGIGFDFNQTGNLSCSDSLCTVNENVSTSTTSARQATLSGTATAVMTAQVTVNGLAASGCTQTETLPINGTGTISCLDPGVAPIVAEIKAEKQQEADEQAQASGQNVNLPYNLDYLAAVQIEAMADVQAEVDQYVNNEQGDQSLADLPPATDTCTVDNAPPAAIALAAYFKAPIEPALFHNGPTAPYTFYGYYTGRLDQFTGKNGQASFEIHVYYKGRLPEYGFFGPAGWFSKHSVGIPANPPPQLESVLKDYAVKWMQRARILKPGDSIKGDDWKRPELVSGEGC